VRSTESKERVCTIWRINYRFVEEKMNALLLRNIERTLQLLMHEFFIGHLEPTPEVANNLTAIDEFSIWVRGNLGGVLDLAKNTEINTSLGKTESKEDTINILKTYAKLLSPQSIHNLIAANDTTEQAARRLLQRAISAITEHVYSRFLVLNASQSDICRYIRHVRDDSRKSKMTLYIENKLLPLFSGFYFCPVLYALCWFAEDRSLNKAVYNIKRTPALNFDGRFVYRNGSEIKDDPCVKKILRYIEKELLMDSEILKDFEEFLKISQDEYA